MSLYPPQLSLVFPLYNEEQRFLQYFPMLYDAYDDHREWEFIFVNDGSTDSTKSVVEEKVVKYSRMKLITYKVNQGKGYALKKGIMAAKSPYILFSDIDLSTPLSQLELFYPFVLKDADIVIGTRKVKGSQIEKRQKGTREWLGRRFTDLTNVILNLGISDYTCGFKIFRRTAARRLFSLSDIKRWGFDAEILFIAQKCNYRIVEVPVVWRNDERTKVNLAKDIVQSFKELINIRLNNIRGKYAV